MSVRVLCPRCPMCFAEPALVMPGAEQAFCGDDDCPCFCWDPSASVAENRRNAGVIDLTKMDPPEATS